MLTQPEAGPGTADTAYSFVASHRTFRVQGSGDLLAVIDVTATSDLYDATFTFTLKAATWDADGGPPLIEQKTSEVNAVCAHPHVQGFRSEPRQNASKVLYNYAVVTVGTDDGQIEDDVDTFRMDQINTPAMFAAIDACWNRLVAAGAS